LTWEQIIRTTGKKALRKSDCDTMQRKQILPGLKQRAS
jgi:hypothetical protein